MQRDEIHGALREFILAHCDLQAGELLTGKTDLFAAGLMDSFMAVSIAGYCEERFGVELEPEVQFLGEVDASELYS